MYFMIMIVPEYLAADGSQINNDLLRFFMAVLCRTKYEEKNFLTYTIKTDLVRRKKYSKYLPMVFFGTLLMFYFN